MNEISEKNEKKELILDIAEKLFSELGFAGASTRMIAGEAQVNMAMLNYYFGSKEGLYKAVLERRMSGFRETLMSLNEESISSWDKVYRCVDMYVDRTLGNNCFHRLIHREMSSQLQTETTDLIAEAVMRNVYEVKRIIEEGIENGSFRPVDVDMTVASLLGTKHFVINSTLISSKMFGKDLSDVQIVQQEINPRMKTYLKDLLTAHLTPNDRTN